jgi:hypothetical protein
MKAGIRLFKLMIMLVTVARAGELVNGGFESDFAGWTVVNNLGGVTVESTAPYVPREGSKLVAFNSVNSPNQGSISQIITTIPGRKYRVTFEAGNLASNNQNQVIRVLVESSSNTLLDQSTLISSNSTTGGTHWPIDLQHEFTAIDTSATLTFVDASSVTNGLDRVLDDVRVEDLDQTFIVTTLVDENDGALGLGTGDSLREALAKASVIPGTNEIRFAPGDSDLHPLGVASGNFMTRQVLLGPVRDFVRIRRENP